MSSETQRVAVPESLPVIVVPEQVNVECGACRTEHLLFRGLDFDEDPAGVWRCTEAGGFIDSYQCDCGALLACAFTLTALPAPEQKPR